MKSLKEIKVPLPRETNAEIRKSVEKAESDMRENFTDIEHELSDAANKIKELAEVAGSFKGEMPNGSSLASNSWVTKANVTLPAGTYMIEYGCAFSANNTGIRRCCLSSTQNSDAAYVRGSGDSKNAVQGTLTYTSGTAIITLSTQRTLYMNARQNSGSSLTVYPWIRAVRIK